VHGKRAFKSGLLNTQRNNNTNYWGKKIGDVEELKECSEQPLLSALPMGESPGNSLVSHLVKPRVHHHL